MRWEQTRIEQLWRIVPEFARDDRGAFARLFCMNESSDRGVPFTPKQVNLSTNRIAGTLRGLHYQAAPHGEDKVVLVTRGAVFDVAVDLRPDSQTYGQWQGFELSSANRVGLLIPAGFAHGFQTLEDDTDVVYLMSREYVPSASAGVRWDDPKIGVKWPMDVTIISDRDMQMPVLADAPPAMPVGD